jgi:tetratricopeptide (TPR) repeat protein
VLFVERAKAAKAGFRMTSDNAAAVAEICVRLDGLPLAIELAAARIALLSAEALARRLDHRLSVLTHGARDADERQRTLRATIEWSHDLLSDGERGLFAELSVFAGGCRLEAVEAVCDRSGEGFGVLDGVASLVGKSLLRERDDPDREPRLWMLETIREFALERLADRGDHDEVRTRHAMHFLALVERAEGELRGRDQLAWYDRLDREHDNVRAALEFSLGREPDVALRIVGSLWRFWEVRGHATEGLRWADRALAQAGGSTLSRARALASAGWMEWTVGDARASERLIGEAYGLYEESGDAARAAFAVVDRGWARRELGDREGAQADAEEGLKRVRETGDRWTEAFALQLLSALASNAREAEALLGQAEAIFLEVGDRGFAHDCRANRGWVALENGRYDEAVQISVESAGITRGIGPTFQLASSLNNAAQGELLRGRPAEGGVYLRESLAVLERAPSSRLAAEALRACAAVAAVDGAAERSGRLFGAARGALERGGFTESVVEERIETELIAPVREAFPEAFARGLEQGMAMQPGEAIAHAQLQHD